MARVADQHAAEPAIRQRQHPAGPQQRYVEHLPSSMRLAAFAACATINGVSRVLTPPPPGARGVQRRNVEFWKFWTGQTISNLGSSFTQFALPLLVFKL